MSSNKSLIYEIFSLLFAVLIEILFNDSIFFIITSKLLFTFSLNSKVYYYY